MLVFPILNSLSNIYIILVDSIIEYCILSENCSAKLKTKIHENANKKISHTMRSPSTLLWKAMGSKGALPF